jgi:hypothetical protein
MDRQAGKHYSGFELRGLAKRRNEAAIVEGSTTRLDVAAREPVRKLCATRSAIEKDEQRRRPV